MKKTNWFLIASAAFAVVIITSAITMAAKADSINEIMAKIGHTMEALFPIVFDDKKFGDLNQQPHIADEVNKLDSLFSKAKSHFEHKSPTYRISYDVIKNQLSDVEVALKYDNYNHAQNILKEFVSICTSCHTQDSKMRTLFGGVKREHFENDLQFAEFNYMTRNYDTAMKYYDRYLGKSGAISETDLMTAMKRILTVYLQVYNNPQDAMDHLAQFKNYPHHTKYTRKNLNEWMEGLKVLKSQDVSHVTNPNMKQLQVYVDKILGPLDEPGMADFPSKKEKVARVWLRGRLFHYLNSQPPKEEIPRLLYWLAIIDRTVNYSFYYSLADRYLKECMLQYTSHPYAEKCYREYETYITFSYSGSRGTDIPDDVEKELKALKVRVFSAPKQ
ncbi:MAG: hypothetical protein PVH98_11300 [Gammaproteobacteria bacterium]|jgi:hypothetical protein